MKKNEKELQSEEATPAKESKALKIEGADVCPKCGELPELTKEGDLFQVKCSNHEPTQRVTGRRVEVFTFTAQGETKEEAVENWNTGKWTKK